MYFELKENKPHGTRSFPYTQYHIWRVKTAFQFPVHWHKELEIIYIQKGSLTIHIDGQSMEAKAGEIYFVNPGELHFMGSEDGSVSYYTLLFPLTFLSFQSEDDLEEELLKPLRNGTKRFPVCLLDKEKREKIAEILDRLIAYNGQGQQQRKQIGTRIYLLEILDLLWQWNVFLQRVESRQGAVQREMLSYIQQHYTEKIALKDLAERFHMSEKYLSRYFKQHFGLNFKQYLQHLRMLQAKNMLETSECSVLEVALSAGFPSVNYFIRTFKELYHITPLQYRKQI